MYKRLEELIKSCHGNVFAVCLDDKLMNEFDKKNNINLYSLISNNNNNTSIAMGMMSKNKKDKPKYKKNNKGKDVNIKKLRKEINKKSVNYIFCNMFHL